MNIRYFRLLLIVRAKREDSLRNRVEAVQMACQRIGFSFTTLPSNARHVLLRWRALLSGILNGGGGSGDDVAPRTHFFFATRRRRAKLFLCKALLPYREEYTNSKRVVFIKALRRD